MGPSTRHLPVGVVGAGPVGLAAAAHLAERGEDVLVIEAGEQIAAAVSEWGHVRIFSPWRYNIDAAAARLLEAEGWTPPPADGLPTGADLVEHYLAPLAPTAALSDKVRLGVRVTNPIGSGGLPAVGEADARTAGAITGPLPDVLGKDRPRFAGRRVVVAGMGHSAANTLMALDALAKVAAPAVAAAAYAAMGSYLRIFVTVGMCSAVAAWALLRAASPSVEGALEAKTC